MIRIELPDRERRVSWVDAMREFDGATLHGFATFGFDAESFADPETFGQWLAHVRRQRVEALGDFVPATVWWIIDDAEPGERTRRFAEVWS